MYVTQVDTFTGIYYIIIYLHYDIFSFFERQIFFIQVIEKMKINNILLVNILWLFLQSMLLFVFCVFYPRHKFFVCLFW